MVSKTSNYSGNHDIQTSKILKKYPYKSQVLAQWKFQSGTNMFHVNVKPESEKQQECKSPRSARCAFNYESEGNFISVTYIQRQS